MTKLFAKGCYRAPLFLFCFLLQAVEAAQLAEDQKVQLEHTQAKLKEIQVAVAENRTARERESSNLKRAQVTFVFFF